MYQNAIGLGYAIMFWFKPFLYKSISKKKGYNGIT
jgi:hypothetical protein